MTTPTETSYHKIAIIRIMVRANKPVTVRDVHNHMPLGVSLDAIKQLMCKMVKSGILSINNPHKVGKAATYEVA